jgi:cobalt-zinc-cadmium resistance protein CzcA
LGANFLPYLDEGWLVVEVQRAPQISLAKSVEMELQTERAIRAAVPEVNNLYSRIGMSEIATDPQGANQNDIYISFKPRGSGAKSTGAAYPNPNWRKSSRQLSNAACPARNWNLTNPSRCASTNCSKACGPIWRSNYSDRTTINWTRWPARWLESSKKFPTPARWSLTSRAEPPCASLFPIRFPAIRFMIAGDVMNNAVSIGLAGREVGRVDEGDIFYPIVVRVAESCPHQPGDVGGPAGAQRRQLVCGHVEVTWANGWTRNRRSAPSRASRPNAARPSWSR